jgi:macrodomain Ter protein organizer (MatP/YcbG family)
MLSISVNMRESYHTFGQFSGVIKNLGLIDVVSMKKVSEEISEIINDYEQRKKINKKMLSLKLENGVNNILSKILSL